MSTLLLSCSTGLAVKLVIALLIEDAMIVGLLEGEPLTVLHLIALKDAFFKRGDGKRVNKDSLALECAMTFSGWTSEVKYCFLFISYKVFMNQKAALPPLTNENATSDST